MTNYLLNMGQEASCCGAPEKTTRKMGKVSYGDKKKKYNAGDRRKQSVNTGDPNSCKHPSTLTLQWTSPP